MMLTLGMKNVLVIVNLLRYGERVGSVCRSRAGRPCLGCGSIRARHAVAGRSGQRA